MVMIEIGCGIELGCGIDLGGGLELGCGDVQSPYLYLIGSIESLLPPSHLIGPEPLVPPLATLD